MTPELADSLCSLTELFPAGNLEVFREHLDALYLVALLYTGEDRLAEHAVVDAMVNAANDPFLTVADPAWVWSLLASGFRVSNQQIVVRGSASATARMAGLSFAQRETMALIVAGRTPEYVAALLEVSSSQVHEDFCTGAWALNTALRARPLPTGRSTLP